MANHNVPIINIHQLENHETSRALDAACRDWGFFQVVDHGIHQSVSDELQAQMRAFFALPTDRKQAISRTAENPWGYYDQELTKNTLDWKQIFDYGPTDRDAAGLIPQWPDMLIDFRPAVLAYYTACETLAYRLLSAISNNLGMPAEHLNHHFQGEHSSYVRLNYYPVCPTPAVPEHAGIPTSGHLGVNHHTDAGALTILVQDQQPGLEVFRDEQWHLVPPVPGALVVNIGDITQVWSNDRYCAPLHRVRASVAAERFSAPFFFNPAYATNCTPLPTTVDHTHPAAYRSINWGEFRMARASGDYADLGDEVQIDQYRIG